MKFTSSEGFFVGGLKKRDMEMPLILVCHAGLDPAS
jgi:hypothetical protein